MPTDEMTRKITQLANEAYLVATQSGMPGAIIAQALTQHGQSEYERGRREAAELCAELVRLYREGEFTIAEVAEDLRGLSEKGEAR